MNEEIINGVINNVKEEGVELLDTENIQTVVTEYGEEPVHIEEVQEVVEEINNESQL